MVALAKLALFSASKQQHAYFKSLCEQVDLPLSLTSYKSLWRPAFGVDIPYTALTEQVEILLKRKRNSAKGKNKSAFYWQLVGWLNLQKAKWLYRQYQAWLQTLDADYIGVWNGKKFRQAILIIAAKSSNKKIIYFETGPLPGYSMVDPIGVNFFSSLPRNAEFYLSTPILSDLPKPPSGTKRPVDLPEDYIFVPFQVVEDSNIYLHSPWINNMRHFYEVLERAAKNNPTLQFIIKTHPACPEQYTDLIEKNNPQIQFKNHIPASTLVEHAKAIITINSTIGIEGLIANKSVIVLGQALYGFEPLVMLASDDASLNQQLAKLDVTPDHSKLKQHFLSFLAHHYAVKGDAMKSPSETHWQAMQQKLTKLLNDPLFMPIE